MPRKKKEYRRGNGQGSVFKLKGNLRKPWVVQVTDGSRLVIDKKTGAELYKPKLKRIGYYPKKEDAEKALLEYRVNPHIIEASKLTLGQVYSEWSESKYKYISKSTVYCYTGAWKYLSSLGDQRFVDIRTNHYQSIIDQCNVNNLSRSLQEKIKAVAVMINAYAVQNDIVTRNYAEFIRLPKEEKEEKETFTDLEIKTIESNIDKPWVDTVLILIYTGLRISELLLLTKFNCDIEKWILTGGIKTDSGKNRIVPIASKIRPLIKKWYDTSPGPLIHYDGKKLSAKKYREDFYYLALESCGVRKLTPHCCRHTFASMLSRSGVNPKDIQALMGHSDYAFTANTYTHVNIDDLEKAVRMI